MTTTKVLIPTHFRFLYPKEAKNWDSDTKTWWEIEEINISSMELSSTEFAWVNIDLGNPNLEFKHDPSALVDDDDDEEGEDDE